MTMASAPLKGFHASPGPPLPNSFMTLVLCPRHVHLLAAHHWAKANSQCTWNKGWQSFPIKDQMVYFISFAGHACVCAKSLQLCLTLCDPMDCNPPGCSVHGILQTRILEWLAMLSLGILPNRGSNPSFIPFPHWQVGSLPLAPPGKPLQAIYMVSVATCAVVTQKQTKVIHK